MFLVKFGFYFILKAPHYSHDVIFCFPISESMHNGVDSPTISCEVDDVDTAPEVNSENVNLETASEVDSENVNVDTTSEDNSEAAQGYSSGVHGNQKSHCWTYILVVEQCQPVYALVHICLM